MGSKGQSGAEMLKGTLDMMILRTLISIGLVMGEETLG